MVSSFSDKIRRYIMTSSSSTQLKAELSRAEVELAFNNCRPETPGFIRGADLKVERERERERERKRERERGKERGREREETPTFSMMVSDHKLVL